MQKRAVGHPTAAHPFEGSAVLEEISIPYHCPIVLVFPHCSMECVRGLQRRADTLPGSVLPT